MGARLGSFRVKHLYETTVEIDEGMAWLHGDMVFVASMKAVTIDVPDGRSQVIIRIDRKNGNVKMGTGVTGWRRWLFRVYNFFTRRYVDVHLASVECHGGVVTEVMDQRQFLEMADA